MNFFTVEELNILHKLWRHRCFGKGHMLIDNLVDGFPTNKQENIQRTLHDLIRKGYLIQKPTKHGHALYINLIYRTAIEKGLKSHYPFL